MIGLFLESRNYIVVTVAVLVGIYFTYYNDLYTEIPIEINSIDTNNNVRLLTKDELKNYNGGDGSPGLYIAILGSVYDVEKGKKHYGPGCGYSIFAGRDASAAFISGNFEENEADDLDDVLNLTESDLISLITWKEFYNKEYTYIGKLIGRFYNTNGVETDYYLKVKEKHDKGVETKELIEKTKETFPPCNIEWNADSGTRVWCTSKSGGNDRGWVGYPRKYYEISKSDYRCACIHSDNLELANLKEYDDCDPEAISCNYVA